MNLLCLWFKFLSFYYTYQLNIDYYFYPILNISGTHSSTLTLHNINIVNVTIFTPHISGVNITTLTPHDINDIYDTSIWSF